MLAPASGTRNRFFFACSVPLRIASGTSFALPRPAPTWPLPSPTMTRAEKLNRRPPLTTLAQRLMSTTRSTSSRSFGLMGVVRTQYLDGPVRHRRRGGSPRLEPQPGFAGAVGHRSHTSVINEPVAVEHHLFDLLFQALTGNQLTHL